VPQVFDLVAAGERFEPPNIDERRLFATALTIPDRTLQTLGISAPGSCGGYWLHTASDFRIRGGYVMSYVLIRHKVRNFAKWKPLYDAHGQTRKAGGSKGARLFRNLNKPKELVILFKWSRSDSARKFVKSKDLRATMKRAGVIDRPDVYFLEEIGHARA